MVERSYLLKACVRGLTHNIVIILFFIINYNGKKFILIIYQYSVGNFSCV